MSDRDLDIVREALEQWMKGYTVEGSLDAIALDGLSRLEERLATAERERDEATVAPDSWKDEEGVLRGYDPGDDPRDALERLGYIYASLPDAPNERRSVAREALHLAESQIDQAERAEARASQLAEALECASATFRQAAGWLRANKRPMTRATIADALERDAGILDALAVTPTGQRKGQQGD